MYILGECRILWGEQNYIYIINVAFVEEQGTKLEYSCPGIV